MDDVQTLAALNILSHVAYKAAEYETALKVPTGRSLVMSTAQEVVKEAYLRASHPDSYKSEDVFYLTDDQFGFAAGVNGIMVREKPATVLMLGAFYAESLLLAETGNRIGAIQIAGTAMPSQIPFFVAACDYTLIGEELFAASAYLSREPETTRQSARSGCRQAAVHCDGVSGSSSGTAGTLPISVGKLQYATLAGHPLSGGVADETRNSPFNHFYRRSHRAGTIFCAPRTADNFAEQFRALGRITDYLRYLSRHYQSDAGAWPANLSPSRRMDVQYRVVVKLLADSIVRLFLRGSRQNSPAGVHRHPRRSSADLQR